VVNYDSVSIKFNKGKKYINLSNRRLTIMKLFFAMDYVRSYLSVFSFLCLVTLAEAQTYGEFDVRRGISPFLLGSVRTQLDSSIQLVQNGEMNYKGRTEVDYAYYGLTDRLYNLEGVTFKSVQLTYVSDTLIRVMFYNHYSARLFPDHNKRGRNEYRKLGFVLTTKWQRAGSQKIFTQSPDKLIVSRGFQWETDTVRMKLALYVDRTKIQPLTDVSVTWELPRYD